MQSKKTNLILLWLYYKQTYLYFLHYQIAKMQEAPDPYLTSICSCCMLLKALENLKKIVPWLIGKQFIIKGHGAQFFQTGAKSF